MTRHEYQRILSRYQQALEYHREQVSRLHEAERALAADEATMEEAFKQLVDDAARDMCPDCGLSIDHAADVEHRCTCS